MTIERMKELPDATLLSLIHNSTGEEFDNMALVLKERGYHLKGFAWTKDANAIDPIEEMSKRIAGEKN